MDAILIITQETKMKNSSGSMIEAPIFCMCIWHQYTYKNSVVLSKLQSSCFFWSHWGHDLQMIPDGGKKSGYSNWLQMEYEQATWGCWQEGTCNFRTASTETEFLNHSKKLFHSFLLWSDHCSKYCKRLWVSHFEKDSDNFEQVQRKSRKMIRRLEIKSCKERLKEWQLMF